MSVLFIQTKMNKGYRRFLLSVKKPRLNHKFPIKSQDPELAVRITQFFEDKNGKRFPIKLITFHFVRFPPPE